MKKIYSRAFSRLFLTPNFIWRSAYIGLWKSIRQRGHQETRGCRICGRACIQSEDKHVLQVVRKSKQFSILSWNPNATGVLSKEK